MLTRRRVSGLFAGIAVIALAACSGSTPHTSPTSPSPLGGSSGTAGATVSGTVTGATAASSSDIGANNVPGLVVAVEGTGISTVTDGAGRFTLSGVPAGDISMRFSGPGVNAILRLASVAERQQVDVQVAISGSSARVTSEHRSSPDSRVEQRGTVSALAGSCPALTFTVGTTTFYTDASTRFEHGRCVDTRNGDRVHAEGVRQADGRVLATEVEFEGEDDDDDDGDDDDRSEVEVRGLVSGLAGTCPALTFTANGVQIVTNASTRFEHGTCADTRNGDRVEVEGSRQADGRVLARKVEFDGEDDDDHDDHEDDDDEDDDRDEAEVSGAVSGLGGSCPNLSFSVSGTAVQTNSSTRFEDGTCSQVQNGRRVEVEGARQPNGSVLARKVELDR